MARRTVGPTRRPRGRRSFAPLVLRRVRESFPAIVRTCGRLTGQAAGRRLGHPSGLARDGSASRPRTRPVTRRSDRWVVQTRGHRLRRSGSRWFVRCRGRSLGCAVGGSTVSSARRSASLPVSRSLARLLAASVPRRGGRSRGWLLGWPISRHVGWTARLAVGAPARRAAPTPVGRSAWRSGPQFAGRSLRRACDRAPGVRFGPPIHHPAGPAAGAPCGLAPGDARVRSTGAAHGHCVPRAAQHPADRTRAPWAAPVTRRSSPHTTFRSHTTPPTVAGVLSCERAGSHPLFPARSRPCVRWHVSPSVRRVGPGCVRQGVRHP